MIRLLMLDSGAFTVWTKGTTIDLDKYIQFCLDHPGISYYVNLDVIPGVPNQKRTITKDSVESSCLQGWKNYRRMLDAGIPKKQIIPVYHQNDPISWLDKYLEFGSPYIGISPANDNTTPVKLRWMRGLRKYLFDGAGRPVVKTHGFAVTSYSLMKYWEWHSVDSASWKLSAAWGAIYVPRRKGGVWDYSLPPLLVAVSPMSPSIQKRQHHAASMSPLVKRLLLDYLGECGVSLGRHVLRQENQEYSLDRDAQEVWYDKKKRVVLEPMEIGVANSLNERLKVNARFVKQANRVLPVKHIYFAGAPIPGKLEYKLGRRLLSFHEIGRAKNGNENKYLKRHLELMEAST